MTSETKRGEKPTLLSKRVLRTNRVNVTEAAKLQERLGQYKNIQRQKEQTHEDNIFGLRFNLRKISRVKEKMEVSAMRRKFLAEHGVNLKMRHVNMDEFVSAVDDVLSKNKTAHASGSMLTESPSALEDKGDMASENTASVCSSGTFPLHLPVDVLKKKSKSRLSASSNLYSDSDSDNEADSSSAQFQSHRPKSGRLSPPVQFRVISPPTKGRRVAEVYKELEEEEKRVQKRIEEKKFKQRLKKSEAWKEKMTDHEKQGVTEKGRQKVWKAGVVETKSAARPPSTQQRKVRKNNFMSEEITNDKVYHVKDTGFPESETRQKGQEEILECEVEMRTKNDDVKDESKQNLEDEFDVLMKKYLKISEENKQQRAQSAKGGQRIREIKEDQGNTKGALYSSHLSSSALGKNAGHFRGRVDRNTTSNIGKDEKNEEGNLSPNSREWRRLVQKTKEDLKIRETTFKTQSPLTKTKVKTARPASVVERGNATHNATGSKSVMKGYATMQMTVGQRAFSIYVPRFEDEAICNGQAAGRANVKSCFEVEQVREKREMQKKRSFTFD